MMNDQISNYSISQLDIPQNVTNDVEKKYFDCINQICNFQEKIPSDLIKNKAVATPQKTVTPSGTNPHGQ